MNFRLLSFIAFFSVLSLTLANLSCLDSSGNAVPWFTLIKYPENVSSSSPRYAYLDPNLGSNYQLVYGSHCDDKNQPLPNTLESINYISESELNLLVYNDEPPNVPYNPDGGHAKGVIAFDNKTQTGVYIMHSFPKFPNVSATDGYIYYTLPKNTYEYAQNAYCISINMPILSQILSNLPVEVPNVYYASGLFVGLANTSSLNSTVSHFELLNGDAQWFLTKNPNFAGFLYEDVIGPYFQTNLAVESWGRPYQDPVCKGNSTYSTLNIDQIAFNEQDTWDHYSDHSKWAISVGGFANLACLCDMNRMDTQEVRGGSCLCSKNAKLYTALSSIVQVTDKCKKSDLFWDFE